MTLKFFLLDLSDERWMAFATQQSQVNIFHHPAWARLLAESYGYHPFIVAVCNSEQQILAGLLMIETKGKLFGTRWVSLPFTDYCQPLYSDFQSFEYLSDRLGHYCNEKKIHKLEVRYELPTYPGSEYKYVRHLVNLCPDVNTVANRFHDTHLKNIKVAQKKSVRIERGCSQEHMDAFYRLQVLTRQRKGIPVQPRKFFGLLRADILDNGLGFILLAYRDDECLAGAVFLHWQHTLTYKYSASSPEGRNLCPNNLILWTAINWGCKNGYTIFDMGRTELDNSGLRWFKNGWGAEEMPLYYFTQPGVDKRSGNSRFMPLLKTLICKSPVWVCRLTGELFYRYSG